MQWSRVVGAVVVSLVLGLGVVACGDDSDDGSATGSDVPGQQFDSPWQLVGDVPLDWDLSLAVVDDTAVVVGVEADGSPGAYYSVDGAEWEPAVGFDALDRPGPGLDMAAGEQGFVAVTSGDGPAGRDHVVVFSADGSSWERIPLEDLPAAEVAWLTDVVAGTDGFVAGFVASGSSGEPPSSRSCGSPPTAGPGSRRIWRCGTAPVAVANDGDIWMAVVVHGPGARPTDPARVFTSVDGMRWTEVDSQDPPSIDTVQEYIGTAFFVADDGTWLLVPAEAGVLGDAPAPWVSTDDGQSWSEGAWSDSPDVVGPDEISGVAVTDDGFVVVGKRAEDATDGPSTTVAFFSEDGASWELQRPVSDFVGVDVLGDDIIALDSGGNVFLWSS